jgi:hypothetical protein
VPQASKCKPDRNRKSGHNLKYKSENRHAKSHIRRIKAHLSRYGKDKAAIGMLMHHAQSVGVSALNSATEFVKGI